MPEHKSKTKVENIVLSTENHRSSAVLFRPISERPGVILGHGAGGNMNARFIRYFQEQIADHGYPCMRFNFFYSEAGKKAPDPQPLLIACYEAALKAMPQDQIVIGGKSMGGRIASYLADHKKVSGLVFLGYPLHPPGKTDQLRDAHLYKIKKPMLFISGTKDPFARFDLLQSTIDRIGKNAGIFAIPGGGHSFEVPKKENRTEASILKECSDKLTGWLAEQF
jgi:predicted alpha/beta-hydrolase family hydrolase